MVSCDMQVVGIELLGYRKRLQYGISELRRTHTQWAELNPQSGQPAPVPGVPKIPIKKRKTTPTPPVGPTHAQLLREDGSELRVRSPSEAMLGGGLSATAGAGKVARVPSDTWKHPNSALAEGCNYHIKVSLCVHVPIFSAHFVCAYILVKALLWQWMGVAV